MVVKTLNSHTYINVESVPAVFVVTTNPGEEIPTDCYRQEAQAILEFLRPVFCTATLMRLQEELYVHLGRVASR